MHLAFYRRALGTGLLGQSWSRPAGKHPKDPRIGLTGSFQPSHLCLAHTLNRSNRLHESLPHIRPFHLSPACGFIVFSAAKLNILFQTLQPTHKGPQCDWENLMRPHGKCLGEVFRLSACVLVAVSSSKGNEGTERKAK